MSSLADVTTAPIVLVPGFWLGAWAWDNVVAALRADGHDVTAITLPGLESPDADRSEITLSDHVEAICRTVTAKGTPVVLAVHSGAGVPGELAGLRDFSYVDLPTGHWPMWSRARELAVILGDVARRSTRR